MNTRILLAVGAVVAALVALWYFTRSGSIGATARGAARGSNGAPLEAPPTVPTQVSFLKRAGVDPYAITSRTTGFASMAGADARAWMGI
jgi:hypothetical protein